MIHPLTAFFELLGDLAFLLVKSDEDFRLKRWFFLVSVLGFILYARLWGPAVNTEIVLPAAQWLGVLSPAWIPAMFVGIFARVWLQYVRSDFIKKSGSVLLEIKLPREIPRTPRAMELFFSSIWEKGSVTHVDTYWDGKVRPWYSFEFASFEGDIHFYVWAQKKFRDIVEAQLYAQYPMIEIYPVTDYTLFHGYHPPDNFLWGTYFKFTRPDPYPIMTYVDFGLDRETEEEFKVDPITSILEYLGSRKKGERVWIQILVRAHTELGLVEGHLLKRSDWKEEAMKEVNTIMLRHPETKSSRKLTPTGFPIIPTLTEGEKLTVSAIERSLSKPPFECAIRACYFAEPEIFPQIPTGISGLLNTFRKPFISHVLNGFKLGWYTDLSDQMKDLLWLVRLREWGIKIFQKRYAEKMLDAYRRRSFFYPPYRNFKAIPLILTAEELATIYHFPGRVAATPTLARIPARKAEAPPNLPV